MGGFGPLNDPVQDTKDVNFASSCPREGAVIFYPVQDWTKHYRVFKQYKQYISFCFYAFQRRRMKLVTFCGRRGGKGGTFAGMDLRHTIVKLYTAPENDRPDLRNEFCIISSVQLHPATIISVYGNSLALTNFICMIIHIISINRTAECANRQIFS